MTEHITGSNDLFRFIWGKEASLSRPAYIDANAARKLADALHDAGWQSPETVEWKLNEAKAEAWEAGLNTGIGYRTAMATLGPDAPAPINPYIHPDAKSGYPNCSTCDGGGCPDCTDHA